MATTQVHAAITSTRVSQNPFRFSSAQSQILHFAPNPSFLPKISSSPSSVSLTSIKPLLTPPRAASSAPESSPRTFHGACFVLSDNIDTDQIIPAEHLTLVPSKRDEYKKLGSFAFSGLPADLYPVPFIKPGTDSTPYKIVIAGANFGCGSSREHAPVALGAAGAQVVIAESYARIFFRNSVATGEVYPLEVEMEGMYKECTTGDIVTVDLEKSVLINHTKGKEYSLKPIGDAGPVIDAGGIFAYARKTGMIASVA